MPLPPRHPRPPAPVPDDGRDGAARTGTQLERLFAAHDAVTARWLEYELDVAKLIAFPAMSDGRQPLTAAFLRAKKVADGLRPASAEGRSSPRSSSPSTAMRSPTTRSRSTSPSATPAGSRTRRSPTVERKRLDTAKQLLTVAIDQAATPAERQLAYRRVRQELDGLISLSDEAIEVLEEKVALELTTGDSPAGSGCRGPAPGGGPPPRRTLAGPGAHEHRPGPRHPPEAPPLSSPAPRPQYAPAHAPTRTPADAASPYACVRHGLIPPP